MSGLQGQGLWDGTGKSEKDQLLELYGMVNVIMSVVQTLERTINVTVKDQFDDIGTKLDSLIKAAGKALPSGGGGNLPGGSGAGASGSGASASSKLGGQIKLAKPDKFERSDQNKAVNFRIACTHYLKIVHQGASKEERVTFIISYLEGVAMSGSNLTSKKICLAATPGRSSGYITQPSSGMSSTNNEESVKDDA
jgi:hypothetical protein